MTISPRLHYKGHMINGAPPESIGAANITGWSTSEKFLEYLKKPSPEDKVILLLDKLIGCVESK